MILAVVFDFDLSLYSSLPIDRPGPFCYIRSEFEIAWLGSEWRRVASHPMSSVNYHKHYIPREK